MDNKFSIGGKNFQLSKIDAFKQFHIVRRVGPILAELVPSLSEFKGRDLKDEKQNLEVLAKIATPVMSGLSKLSDADSETVLFGLLSAVEVQQSVGWAKVSQNGMLMMQDLELPVLLQLAAKSFMYNLQGFFSALPAK